MRSLTPDWAASRRELERMWKGTTEDGTGSTSMRRWSWPTWRCESISIPATSLSAISDLLKGEGIRFKRLVGEFAFQNGVMTTDLIRAYGDSLGITAQGEVDFERSISDLRGTVVPAYSVNQVLGEIPLLGLVLTGGKGQGVFAVTYRLTGDLEDPEVSVNALSALTPGFLRGLFTARGGDSEDEKPRAMPEERSAN